MDDRFEPMERSAVWLADPADATAWTQINQDASRTIEGLSVLELCDVVSDLNQPERIRWHALCRLHPDEVTRLLGELLWDDGDNYWTVMIGFARLDSERVRSGLKRHRNSSVLRNRLAAIQALAILKDTSVVADIDEVLKQALVNNSGSLLFAAIGAFGELACLESRDRLTALICDDELEEDFRVAAAEKMLEIGQVIPAFQYLTGVAATCRGREAPTAARAIRSFDRREGTRLMLEILENGDNDAKQVAVLYVSFEMGQLDASFHSSGLKLAQDYLRSFVSE